MMRKYLIDPREWEDVASDLGLGIGYWCRELTDRELEALEALHVSRETYTVAVMAVDPDSGEDDQLLLMSRRDYEAALGLVEDVLPGTMVSGYVSSAWANRDQATGFIETSYVDADVADAVAQIHLFGEVLYG